MAAVTEESGITGGGNFWRSLLILGRVSNLPTVWSNCLAGWILGGGRTVDFHFFLIALGTTLLYLGGMYLNDAIDVEFDQLHRKERPIPSGAIHLSTVWGITIGLILGGNIVLFALGRDAMVLSVLLTLNIVVYDIVHKWISFAPVLMAGCRFWLLLIAAAAAPYGITGLAMWSAIVLAGYIIGLSYIARRESLNSPVNAWPILFLLLPALLALLVSNGEFRFRGIVLSLLFLGWIVYCLRFTFWSSDRNVGRTVSGLLAGIVLVDLLSICGGSFWEGIAMVCLFVLALLFQRFIPAT